MMEQVLINGQPLAELPVTDRGLHYGDGLFETVAIINGKPRFWQHHLNRLFRGCTLLRIPTPDPDILLREVVKLAQDVNRCVIKIIITRGSGGRGYRPLQTASTTRIVIRYSFPDYPQDYTNQGITVRVCDTPLGRNPVLAGIKHLNRLEQVLARSEWDDPDIQEGVMLDSDGYLIEGTMTNLFIVKDGMLYTPELTHCGVAGVMREVVMELARKEDVHVECTTMRRSMLEEGSELFLTNSLIGIWPVVRCDQHVFPAGPVTNRLQQSLAPLLEH